jgi:hypothetical protein
MGIKDMVLLKRLSYLLFIFGFSIQALAGPQQDSSDKPNILVIWADDVG